MCVCAQIIVRPKKIWFQTIKIFGLIRRHLRTILITLDNKNLKKELEKFIEKSSKNNSFEQLCIKIP